MSIGAGWPCQFWQITPSLKQSYFILPNNKYFKARNIGCLFRKIDFSWKDYLEHKKLTTSSIHEPAHIGLLLAFQCYHYFSLMYCLSMQPLEPDLLDNTLRIIEFLNLKSVRKLDSLLIGFSFVNQEVILSRELNFQTT